MLLAFSVAIYTYHLSFNLGFLLGQVKGISI